MYDDKRQIKHLKITVSVLTRRRPQMLSALIYSWGKMDLPENCEVSCLVVENHEASLSRAVVEQATPLANGLTVNYCLETNIGIPIARNRAVREAIKSKSDLIIFVDDDEVVAQNWLVELVSGYRNSRAVLLGGPVLVQRPSRGLKFFERRMHRSISRHYLKRERRARRRSNLNETPGVVIFTNNWLAEVRLFTEWGIWFNEEMRHTGGTDAIFCSDVKKANFIVGWVKRARVYECVSSDRLSFGYQFGRARDRSSNNFYRKLESGFTNRRSLLVTVPVKSIAALALALAVPVTGGRTLLTLARTSGWVAGRVGAAFGYRSSLYSKVTGN